MRLIRFLKRRKRTAAVYTAVCLLFLVFWAVRFRLPALFRTAGLLLVFAGMAAVTVYRIRANLLWETPAALLALWLCVCALVNAKGAVTEARADELLKSVFVLLIVFPLGSAFADSDHRYMLNVLAGLAVAVFGVLFAAGLGAYLHGASHSVPPFGGAFGVGPEGYMQILGEPYDICAYIALSCFFAGLYLFSACRKYWVRLLLVPFELLFAAAVVLSVSRVCLTVLVLSCVIGLYLWTRRLTRSRKLARLLALDGLVLAVFLFLALYGEVSALTVRAGSVGGMQAPLREATDPVSTLSGRTRLYGAVIPAFSAHPRAWLFGFDCAEQMGVINSLSGARPMPDMRNGFLQILTLAGIPGLLFTIWMYLEIFIECLRAVFAGKGLYLRERVLCLMPLALMAANMLDCVQLGRGPVFLDGIFFLFSGYLICAGARSDDIL